MADNLNQFSYPEDEISLQEIFKTLFASKKLIISTILIFTIASIVYSLSLKPSFKSSTYLEIGYYEMLGGSQELIETPSDLISDLEILLLKNPEGKFSQNVSMDQIHGKLINLKTTSISAEQNENLLIEIFNYIGERHANLAVLMTDQKKRQISNEIELIKSEISFLKEITQANLEASISKLKNDLPILDQEISQLNQVIIDDSYNLNIVKGSTLALERAANSPTLEQIISSYRSKINQLTRERNNSISDISILSQKLDALNKDTFQSDELFVLGKKQKVLENNLQMSTAQTYIKTNIIGDTQTNTIKPKTQFIISLGMILGFISSIFLVFIRSFIKAYR
ncbi:Wzz/FepE/Etk N-terminal domain-containing protein [Candidatus Pseudothioglobus singularis]|nr:Wzz/FepE/Etk N-terminal domain-containing protein [Candidatus Pseudothioglobus singularis]